MTVLTSPRRSVRRFLLTYLLLSLVAMLMVLAGATYLSARHEFDEVYNANLRNIAHLVEHQVFSGDGPVTQLNVTRDRGRSPMTREEEYFIRVYDARGRTVYVSHPSIQIPAAYKAGFNRIPYAGMQWRVYLLTTPEGRVEIAQALDLRADTLNEISAALLLPQLVLLPLFGLVIWLLVGLSLKPVRQLSRDILQRNENLLEPVPHANLPQEIQPLVDAFNGLLKRLEAMIGTLRRFTSDAAHELRTPLTALRLQAAVIEQAKNANERELALQQLNSGIDRASMLVQQLLTLARMEPGAADMVKETIDVPALVTEAVEAILPMTLARRIDIGVTQLEDVALQGHAGQLTILLSNLLSNAVRHTPDGGKVDVAVFVDAQAGHPVLTVQDSGPGIDPAEMDKVFDRFYRGRNQTASSGTGLGLAIVKDIARQHHARITLTNTQPGLLVTVTFETV